MPTSLPTYEPTIKPEKKTAPLLNCNVSRDDNGLKVVIKSQIIGNWMKAHAKSTNTDNAKDFDIIVMKEGGKPTGWEDKKGYRVTMPEMFAQQFNGWGQSLTIGPGKQVNLAFLRAVGLDSEEGVTFLLSEVFTTDQIDKFKVDFHKEVTHFARQCVKKMQSNITLIIEETA